MEEQAPYFSAEDVARLGYNPEEASDCSFPETIDLKEKKELLKWKFLEGGERVPWYIPKIPHVKETEVHSTVLQDEAASLELAQRLAADAKQVMSEYVYAKQRFDLLKQERDLLKWHLASNSKVNKLKDAEANELENQNRDAESRLKDTSFEFERLDRERAFLSVAYQRDEAALENVIKDFERTQAEMESVGRRGDYLNETTVERRQANHERRLRYRQWKKLARYCAVDKKWHSKIDAARNYDNLIFEAFEDAANLLSIEFDHAGDVTGPARERVLQEISESDPLANYTPSNMRRPSRREDL